jgi:hypothetical protein
MTRLEEEFAYLKSGDPNTLWRAKEEIDSFYRAHADILAELKNEEKDLYSMEMAQRILNMANTIRTTWKCPPGWREGLPWINMFPPAPQPEHMRNGILAQFSSNEPVTTSNVDHEKVESTNNMNESKEQSIAAILALKQQMFDLFQTHLEVKDDVEEDYDEYEGEENIEMNIDEIPYVNEGIVDLNPQTLASQHALATNQADSFEAANAKRRTVAATDFGNFGEDSEEED